VYRAGVTTKRTDYRSDIDGLRAIAVLAVLAFHAFPRTVGGGFVGVDIFFVISGYLITGILLEALEQGTFGFGWFYARRIRRIVPALAVVLIACAIFGWFELLPRELMQLCRQIMASVAFVANFEFWNESSYFDGVAESKPLLHLWSLGIEEQFYLVWPLVLWLAWRRRFNLFGLTVAIIVLSFGWSAIEVHIDRIAAFYSPATRIWELLAGALLMQMRPGRRPAWLSWIGLALIAIAIAGFDRYTLFPGYWAALPVVGTALLIATPDGWVNRRVLAQPVLVGIGLISYPLYLWHWPLLSFAHVTGVEDSTGLRVLLLAASFVLAWVTWRLVERPVRAPGALVLKAVALASILVAVGLAALMTYRLDGVATRFPERVRALADYHYNFRSGARLGECWLSETDPYDGFAKECWQARPDARTILLWGDSHAGALYPGLRQAAPPDVDLLEMVRSSCPPVLGLSHVNCIKSNAFVLDEVRRLKPDTVLLFASWPDYSTPPGGPDLTESFERTLADIQAAGVKKIVMLGPAPRWNLALPRLLVSYLVNHPEQQERPERMTFGLASATPSIDAYWREVAARHGVTYVSLLDLLCTAEGCPTGAPGSDELSAWDTAHFTRPMANRVAAGLFAAGALP